jgi:hypothetical protein
VKTAKVPVHGDPGSHRITSDRASMWAFLRTFRRSRTPDLVTCLASRFRYWR